MSSVDPFLRIERLLRSKEYVEALGLLLRRRGDESGKGMKLAPLYKGDRNHAWYLVGVALWEQDRLNAALMAFERSRSHWKEDVSAIRAIGTCYLELRKAEMAKHYFRKAIWIGGESYKYIDVLHYNLGNAYFDLERYEPAIAEYGKVRKSDVKTYGLARKNIKRAKERLRRARKKSRRNIRGRER